MSRATIPDVSGFASATLPVFPATDFDVPKRALAVTISKYKVVITDLRAMSEAEIADLQAEYARWRDEMLRLMIQASHKLYAVGNRQNSPAEPGKYPLFSSTG